MARASSKRRSLPWAVFRLAAAVVLGYLAACTLLLVAYRWVEPPGTTVMVQRAVEAAVAGEPFSLQYYPVPESGQDDDVRHAAVASEDGRFYGHDGFDRVEIERAWADRKAGRGSRGASTITQQTVKNLFLTTHRSFVRKGFEVPLTLLAEWILPKDRILTLYLDVAEWGPGVFGIEAAARHHYGTTAASLTRDQAARLVAVLPAPLVRRPQDQDRTARRIKTRMSQAGW